MSCGSGRRCSGRRRALAYEPYNLLARYQMIVGALRDLELTRGHCVVLSVIVGHVGSDGGAWPGLERICAQAHVSRSTAIRAIQKLEDTGYLATNRQMGKVNYYTITPDAADRIVPTRVTHDTGQVVTPVSPVTPPRVIDDTTTRVTHDTEPVSPVTPELGLELDSLNLIQVTRLNEQSFDYEVQERERKDEQERVNKEHKEKQRNSIRAEYLDTLFTHPEWAKRMERQFPNDLADLINKAAA